MKRSISILIAIVIAAIAPAHTALAQPAPTKDQLENAKKAFGEGKALYEEGKLPEAVEKFKESYRLSRNPLLLYNIGHTLDQSGQKDTALFYYRKFLADAPKNAAQRKDVTKRVEEIEKEKLEADLAGTSPTGSGTATTTTTGANTKKPEEPKPAVAIKPAGTYSEKDFEHQLIDVAPPGKPLDITAFVPEDSGFVVTLYYRGSGDTKFNAKTMKWRYKELVGRIPGPKVFGSTIQYYIEAKDEAGNVIAKSGKSTSPNLIDIQQGAAPRFYPDLTDEAEPAMTATEQKRRDEEDPLGGRKTDPDPDPTLDGPIGGSTGPIDAPKKPNAKAKWISTGVAGGLLAGAIVTYILGSQQASNLIADRDSRMGNNCMAPPCFEFDSYDIDVEKAGNRYNSMHTFTMVTGIIASGVAGYFWYKEFKAKKRGSSSAASKPAEPELVLTPSLGDGFAGAAAVGRF